MSGETAGPQPLPCPFCGAGAQVCGDSDVGYFVACTAPCGAALGEEYDAAAYPNHDFATEDAAIAAWNRRIAPAVQQPERQQGGPFTPEQRRWWNMTVAESPKASVQQPDASLSRDALGRIVREAWVRWARGHEPNVENRKPSWLVPYDELSEPEKEADRQIGEAVTAALSIPPAVQPDALRERVLALAAKWDALTADNVRGDHAIAVMQACASELRAAIDAAMAGEPVGAPQPEEA